MRAVCLSSHVPNLATTIFLLSFLKMPITGFRTHLGCPLPSVLNSITSTKTPFPNKDKAILPDSGGLNLLEASIQPFVMENRLGLLNTQADLIGSEHTVKERLNLPCNEGQWGAEHNTY